MLFDRIFTLFLFTSGLVIRHQGNATLESILSAIYDSESRATRNNRAV